MKPSFVALDLETATSYRGSICQIGITEVVDGVPQKPRSWLVQPEGNEYDEWNIWIHGITPKDFWNNKNLTENFELVTTGFDLNGKEFVNAVESKEGLNHHIFATQFHAEKNPYIRKVKYNDPHTMDALRRSQLFALRFVEEARRNCNEIKEDNFREKYTFISTYKKGTYDLYDKSEFTYYFYKK